jgi:hypothetical protein
MPIMFHCDCGQELQARDEHAGRRTRCPKCGKEQVIPAVTAAQPPAAAPRPEAVTRRPQPAPRQPAEEDEDDRPRRKRRDREPARTSVVAISSLVLGILSPCLLLLTGLPAIVLGVIGLFLIRGSGGRVRGTGFAIGGIVLGCVGLLCTGLTVPIFWGGVGQIQSAAAKQQSTNNLRQISMALQIYSDSFGRLPPAVVYDRNGTPLYSWRVLILPFVEQENLYHQFHLDEPWDSPHNKPLLAQVPNVYAPPKGRTSPEPYGTYYQVFDGPGAAFNSDKAAGLQPFNLGGLPPGLMASSTVVRFPMSFTDGTSNTFLVAEAGDPVPWSKPGDLRFSPTGPLPKLGGLFGGDFNVALADGSPRMIRKNTPETTIRAAITIAGNEIVNLP